MKEAILDNILGNGHVDLTILNCPRNISMVVTIWKWLLTQTTMEGFSLKKFFFSYNESYIPKVDVEGMIVSRKKETLIKENERRSCA
jgi:hypothetical protein